MKTIRVLCAISSAIGIGVTAEAYEGLLRGSTNSSALSANSTLGFCSYDATCR